MALLLSGGGARSAYQVGVLRRIGRHRPDLAIPILTGVSAGAINSVFLAAHTGGLGPATEALESRWRELTPDRVFRSDPKTLISTAVRWSVTLGSGGARIGPKARSLVDTRPLREFLTATIDPNGIDENLHRDRLRAAAVSATDLQTGQTVTFVHGPPSVGHWERGRRRAIRERLTIEHVMASSALPLLFPAVRIGDRYYGDGSIRQSAPLSPAIHLGADRILSISIRYDRSAEEAREPTMEDYPPPAQVLGLLFNSVFLDTLDADVARLERVNHLLEQCGPAVREEGPGSTGAAATADEAGENLRRIEHLLIRPSENLGELASEYADRLPRTVRFLVGGLGGREGRTSDFVSYLLFEPGYIGRLIEMGERDAEAAWPRIAEFLAASERPVA